SVGRSWGQKLCRNISVNLLREAAAARSSEASSEIRILRFKRFIYLRVLTRCLVRNEEESVSPRHSSGCWSAPGLRRKSPRLLTHCAAGRRGHRKACPMATRSCKNGCAPYVLTPQLVVNSRLSWMPRVVPKVLY